MKPVVRLSLAADNVDSVATADLDGDGDGDIVSTAGVFLQDAPRMFTALPSFTPGGTSVAAADLDGDGDLDLVSANGNSHDLTVFLGR